MNVDLRQETIGASGQLILPPANYLFIINASVNVNVSTQREGNTETFNNVGAGLLLARLKPYTRVVIAAANGTTVQFFYGNQVMREDSTLFQATIASISGSVSTVPGLGSANAPTDATQTALATATQGAIAANAARKSVTIGSLSSNAPATLNLRVGNAALAVNQGIELQPGTFYNFVTTAALRVRNDDANSQTYWVQEYT